VRTAIHHPAIAMTIAVYRAAAVPIDLAAVQPLRGSVALLHSARAAQHLAAAIDGTGIPRASLRLAAISAKAAVAAGGGWDRIAIAAAPTDEALIAVARLLAIDP